MKTTVSSKARPRQERISGRERSNEMGATTCFGLDQQTTVLVQPIIRKKSAAARKAAPPPVVPPAVEFDVAACIQSVQKGDQDAARQMVQHFFPLVIKVVRAHLPRRTSEEDLAQTVFMKIFANLHQYSGKVPLSHWISRIAVNTCFNQLSAERIRPELRWADLSEEEQYVIEALKACESDLDHSDSIASRELVEKLLAHLNPDDRLLLTLLHLEGRTVQEIREITGWNAPLIKVRAFRARHRLRKHLGKLMREKSL